jgi:hypothetical protein
VEQLGHQMRTSPSPNSLNQKLIDKKLIDQGWLDDETFLRLCFQFINIFG